MCVVVVYFSCASASSNCQKFFDLTGPLQIGGVPTLPSTFQIENKEYIGCMKDFYMDYKLVDFSQAVANNGSEPGCGEKKAFCRSSPCQHGGMKFRVRLGGMVLSTSGLGGRGFEA